jgi:hypothetical protein
LKASQALDRSSYISIPVRYWQRLQIWLRATSVRGLMPP